MPEHSNACQTGAPRLLHVHDIRAQIELITPTHIGSGERDFGLRSVEHFTAKRRDDGMPVLPGSSLKGAMRAGLEQALGLAGADDGAPLTLAGAARIGWPAGALQTLQLFGAMAQASPSGLLSVGPARCRFWDALPAEAWLIARQRQGQPLTDRIDQVQIDRASGATRRRQTLEVVPAGAVFDWRLTWLVYEGDDTQATLQQALALLQRRGVGRGTTRGLGQFRFCSLACDGQSWPSAGTER